MSFPARGLLKVEGDFYKSDKKGLRVVREKHSKRQKRKEECCLSGSYLQVNVLCPFYLKDDGKNQITCEGVSDDSKTVLVFRDKNAFMFRLAKFCCDQFESCEIHHILMEKYKEE